MLRTPYLCNPAITPAHLTRVDVAHGVVAGVADPAAGEHRRQAVHLGGAPVAAQRNGHLRATHVDAVGVRRRVAVITGGRCAVGTMGRKVVASSFVCYG